MNNRPLLGQVLTSAMLRQLADDCTLGHAVMGSQALHGVPGPPFFCRAVRTSTTTQAPGVRDAGQRTGAMSQLTMRS